MSEQVTVDVDAPEDVSVPEHVVEFTAEQNRRIAHIVRKEVEKARRNTLAATEAEYESKYQTQLQELQAQLAKTTGEMQTYKSRADVTNAAAKARALNPEYVFKLIRDDLTYGDDGAPANLDDLLKNLRQEMPQLFTPGPSGADGGAGGEAAGGADMNQLIRGAIRRRSNG